MEKTINSVFNNDMGFVLLVLAWIGLSDISTIAGIGAAIVVMVVGVWRMIIERNRWKKDKRIKDIEIEIKEEELKKIRRENER
ncbi:MAG: hypothetical protein AAF944_26025 [Bacteroidota bacterium]